MTFFRFNFLAGDTFARLEGLKALTERLPLLLNSWLLAVSLEFFYC